MTKALLRWAGGKEWIADRIVEATGLDRSLYVEPFAGSLAVFLARYTARGGPENAIIGDALPDVINLYRAVQANPLKLCQIFDGLPRLKWSEAYLSLRATFNAITIEGMAEGRVDYDRAALFLWLNRTCFNGVCRFNRSGGFNVPVGSMPNPRFPSREEIHDISRALIDSELHAMDFEKLSIQLPEQSTIYCDSPYLPKNGSFVGYSGDGFGESDHYRLAAWTWRMMDAGARVVVSNHDVPDEIGRLYPSFRFDTLSRPMRRNSVSQGDRKQTGEILLRSRANA